jgi:hypothetical protein
MRSIREFQISCAPATKKGTLAAYSRACPISGTAAFDLPQVPDIQYISNICMSAPSKGSYLVDGHRRAITGSSDVAFRACNLIFRAHDLPFWVVVALAVCGARPAFALDPRYPDWPCQQLKVPEISIASVWSGPPIETNDTTGLTDSKEEDLVARLAARRTPMEDARKLIADYVVGASAERQQKAKSLFAALYARLNGQRSEVMNGIERFSRKQKAMAEAIRGETQKLRAMQDQTTDQAQTEQLTNQLAWQTRIFEDRGKSTSYVCDVPVLIEKRLFDLAAAIQDAMNDDSSGK